MFQAKHCDLCEYPKRDFNVGLRCGLTDKKPDFKVACPKLKFSDSLKMDLTLLLGEIENLKKNKTYQYINFMLLTILGLVIIIGYNFELNKILVLDFSYRGYKNIHIYYFFNFLGMMCISMAYSKLYSYRKTIKKLKFKKNETNKLLKNYNTNISKLLNHKELN